MRTMTITIERTPRTLQFCDRPIEVEELSVRLPFARKADNLREMTSCGNAIVYVTETVEMTAHEFDDFANSCGKLRGALAQRNSGLFEYRFDRRSHARCSFDVQREFTGV